jgi:hypothetical protein
MEHLTNLIKVLSKYAETAYDKRKGNNLSHSLRDIIMFGFAVFWFQVSNSNFEIYQNWHNLCINLLIFIHKKRFI